MTRCSSCRRRRRRRRRRISFLAGHFRKMGWPMTDFNPKEYKVVALRDCPVPEQMQICEQPQQVADYWRMHIATHPYFNPDCECFVVLLLNTRLRVKGHHLVSIGTMDM